MKDNFNNFFGEVNFFFYFIFKIKVKKKKITQK